MASSTTILDLVYALAIFSLVTKGMCDGCKIQVLSQEATGKTVNGKAEYKVDIFNPCVCPQSDAQLDCPGFHTAETIDPNVLILVKGDKCVIPGLIPPLQGTFFTYASDSQFPFNPAATYPGCS